MDQDQWKVAVARAHQLSDAALADEQNRLARHRKNLDRWIDAQPSPINPEHPTYRRLLAATEENWRRALDFEEGERAYHTVHPGLY